MSDAFPNNVLASRYASAAMVGLWDETGRVRLEREFWIAVLKAQRELGLSVPEEAIAAYEATREEVDLASIRAREAVSRHDVKARLEEFCALAGHEYLHQGLTSRDLTENVEQLQVHRGLQMLLVKGTAALRELSERAEAWKSLPMTARTHNVPAQLTTLGRRLAMFAEELLLALETLEQLIASYPARGLKGAVGTQLDLLRLFAGEAEKVSALETQVARFLGLPRVLCCPGQVYPRSLDLQVVSVLMQLVSGPSSFATTWRLMAGEELATEGFALGQTGSSAMPHKMNARSCERLNGFANILRGHLQMVAGMAGGQWNEGDVSCSVVRRTVLPDAFFAADGALETFRTIIAQMEVYPAKMAAENARMLPFLLTTTLLMEAIKAGTGRETAHAMIKKHATAVLKVDRLGEGNREGLFARLAADADFPLGAEQIEAVASKAAQETGQAVAQTEALLDAASAFAARFPEASCLPRGEIL